MPQKQAWTVYLHASVKVGTQAKHRVIEDDTNFVVIGDTAESAASAFATIYSDQIQQSFISGDALSFANLMKSHEGHVATNRADDLLAFVESIEPELGSIKIDRVLGEFDRGTTLRMVRYFVSEGDKQRVLKLSGEEDEKLTAEDVVALIEAKF